MNFQTFWVGYLDVVFDDRDLLGGLSQQPKTVIFIES